MEGQQDCGFQQWENNSLSFLMPSCARDTLVRHLCWENGVSWLADCTFSLLASLVHTGYEVFLLYGLSLLKLVLTGPESWVSVVQNWFQRKLKGNFLVIFSINVLFCFISLDKIHSCRKREFSKLWSCYWHTSLCDCSAECYKCQWCESPHLFYSGFPHAPSENWSN